eukprot:scaffold6017_cov48-Phaeocystis_antarctica.AAC.2
MPLMSVTLDVSKLSGWLNADAPCGVEGGIVGRRIQRQEVLKGIAGCIRVGGGFGHARSAPETCGSCL